MPLHNRQWLSANLEMPAVAVVAAVAEVDAVDVVVVVDDAVVVDAIAAASADAVEIENVLAVYSLTEYHQNRHFGFVLEGW